MKPIISLTVFIVVLFTTLSPVLAQMSPEEAAEKLRQREAIQTTQPDTSELDDLKIVVQQLQAKNEALQKQIETYRRLVPEVPQVGWNMSRLKRADYARTCCTDCVFNVSLDGKLETGTLGERVNLTSQSAGMSMTLGNGEVVNTVSYQHQRLAQLALYNVFINNNTPYDPTVDPQTNLKRMTDAYVVLVNVDSGSIDFAERNDDIWNDILAQHQKEETTIIMEKTLVIEEKTTSN